MLNMVSAVDEHIPLLSTYFRSGYQTMKRTHLTALIVSGLIVTGCATDDPNRRAKGGAVIGALAGAVLGNQVADGEGALVGGVLGGLAGYKVGQYQDEQQKELELALADELAASQIDIQRMEGDVLRVNLSSEASFDVNQAELRCGCQLL